MNNANIIATNSKSLEVAAFMVAKTSGTINPIALGMNQNHLAHHQH